MTPFRKFYEADTWGGGNEAQENYPIKILRAKLGEWEGIYEHWNQQMYGPNGPFKEGAEFMDEAIWRIRQLKQSIKILSNE